MTDSADRLNLLLGLRRFAAAEATAREAIARNPECGSGYTHLARALLARNRGDEAVEAAREGARLAPQDAWAVGTLACALNWFNRPKDALDPARRAVQLDPTYAWAYAMLANVLANLNHFEEAREAAVDGLRHDAENESLFRWKGWADYNLGRLDEARATAEAGVRLHPNSHLLLNLLGRVDWARAEQARGRRRLSLHRTADVALAAAARLDPAQPSYQSNRRDNAVSARTYVFRWAFFAVAMLVAVIPTAVFAEVAQPTSKARYYIFPLVIAVGVTLYALYPRPDPATVLAVPLGRLPRPPAEPGDGYAARKELAGYAVLLMIPAIFMMLFTLGGAVRF
ncbi:MAG: tetratricopeptide repeat protein [Gemmataceae bacterium]|nr:tetratricopeptide repeat protein [Gemmataceae bacterium]